MSNCSANYRLQVAFCIFATISMLAIYPATSWSAGIKLVGKGAIWSYLDDGSDPGLLWRDPAFNDVLWQTGPAELGYGDGDEATVVSFGPDVANKYISTYFRHTFNIADASSVAGLTLRLLRDDGAVVYLLKCLWMDVLDPV